MHTAELLLLINVTTGKREHNSSRRCGAVMPLESKARSHFHYFLLTFETHAHTHPFFLDPGKIMQRPGQRDVCQHNVQGGERRKLHAKQAQPLSSQSSASKKKRKTQLGLRHLALRLFYPRSLLFISPVDLTQLYKGSSYPCT